MAEGAAGDTADLLRHVHISDTVDILDGVDDNSVEMDEEDEVDDPDERTPPNEVLEEGRGMNSEGQGEAPDTPTKKKLHGILVHQDSTSSNYSCSDLRLRYERIIAIAVDGSSHSEYALDFYLDNLHHSGNYVVLVYAFELPMLSSYQEVYGSPEMWQMTLKKEADRISEFEKRLKEKLNDYQVPGKFVTKPGKPGEVIVKTGEEEDVDMIVTGTRGHGKLRRTIMGSVSGYVMHHASCPVTVCRPKGMRSRTSSVSSNSSSRDRTNSWSEKDKKTKRFVFRRKRHYSEGEINNSNSNEVHGHSSESTHRVSFSEQTEYIDSFIE